MEKRQTLAKKNVNALLELAGIEINGSREWDIQIRDERFYDRVLKERSLGFGESYMEGWWECERIDELIKRIQETDLSSLFLKNIKLLSQYLLHRLINFQTKTKSWIVAKRHYDLGNDLFEAMLDKEMLYSCGFWQNANNIDEAQINKLELSCQKLELKKGLRLLDIGCGWGGMAKYAAQKYGVEVVGITLSKEQKALADKRCKEYPIEIRLQDYRELHEKFDRIVSIGMFEHVGHKNYHTYFETAHRCLKEDGIFLLHTIGSNTSTINTDPWINKYIFPNGHLPSIKQIATAVEGLFIMEDWHNFGVHYDKTLMAWHKNFNERWKDLEDKYGEKFLRMWNFYLLSCAGGFRARVMQLWQIVLTKNGLKEGFNHRGALMQHDLQEKN